MISEEKAAARKAAFARRKAVQGAAAQARACEHLNRFLEDFADQPISGYMAINTEIDPLAVMTSHAQNAPVGVPVIPGPGQPLEFHRWTPDTQMQDGPFRARVPVDQHLVTPRVVILPLAAFDLRGHRLGYGGGFYDRTLEMLRRAGPVTAVGFAFAGQEADELPIEATDQPMDAVVTENGIRQFA